MEKKTPYTSISFTAGRHKLPGKYRISEEGDTAVAYVMLHGGVQFTVNRERWEKFLSDLNGNPPPIFLHNNRAKGKGRFYLAVILPQGKQMQLARVLYEKEARGSLDLSRICAAPITRLGRLAFEGQGAFAPQS